ncbi:2S globulin [Corchorus olitorius]|uniref:2S globulin n=1 Tax=Corchorus olitorius TaxID=93759 RepID=A0A1R3J974_9ROSI|nr:2S globulin [Corchorus olitorius]
MEFCKILFATFFLLLFSKSNAANSKLFREYIGAESDVKLSDVPIIDSSVEFHFILAFAIDYTDDKQPTNGKFNVFWETDNLGPKQIASIKDSNSNVKIAVSLGGDTVVGNNKAFFTPKSTESWVQNAVSSLSDMIQQYHIDGIDIDYEHFKASPEIFAECIGELIKSLKNSGTISFASIAPYDDDTVQSHYLELWRKYGHVIDYVNFQFYAYDKLSVSEFVSKFKEQASNYGGSQLLASFESGGGGGLNPNDGFFEACKELKEQEKLGGIFIWCADESQKSRFQYEKKSQDLLAA